jgi:hypothetical protein
VGTLGVGIMNLVAFSLLANSSPEVDKNKKMELTFRSLSFYIGPLGSTCLSNPVKLGPSTSKTEIIAKSRSSVGSSSEANSPVSLTATENLQEKLEEPDEIRQKFITEAATDKPCDKLRDLASESSGISRSVHQLCIIITEATEEENNHAGNKEIDMQVDKLRSNARKEREKVHVSAGEWRMIISAINHGTDVPVDSRREVLMGYQYALHQCRNKLRQERDMIMRNPDYNSASSGGYWGEYSDSSESSMERHRVPKHIRRTIARTVEESHIKSPSTNQPEEEEEFVQETPEAALVASQAYLLTTQPKPGDPREHMHQAAIQSLGLVEDKLRENFPEKNLTHHKEKQKEGSSASLHGTKLATHQKMRNTKRGRRMQ